MSEFVPFERLAIVGLGLLGGSVALAARRAGVARTIVGAGRRRAPLEEALEAGVVDRIATPEEAMEGADGVVLATPVGVMARLMAAGADGLADGAIVTDVGSVKGPLVELLPGLLPGHAHYVGAHPMAGSHHKGVAHAREDLFDGACCVVTPRAPADGPAVDRVIAFWQSLGARVVRREPDVHDSEVAWMSHLPHFVAFAFARALRAAPAEAGEVAGGGFRDFTRIAASDAELWGEILTVNRKALAGPLAHFGEALSELSRVLEVGDTEALEQLLADARSQLAALSGKATGDEQAG